MAFGTNTTLDLAVSRFQYANMTVADYGETRLGEGIEAMLAAHNDQVLNLMGDLCAPTTQRLAMFGTGDIGQMVEIDEMGSPPPQKAVLGAVVGFPLKRYGYAWQGTRQYFRRATVGEVMTNTTRMMDSDKRNIVNQIRLALFNPVNYTFSDDLVDHLVNTPLPVKRLLNADGLPIPPGPNGETFDPATHTHYLGTSSFVAGDMVTLKETVLEHYASGEGMFVIPRALATTIQGFTPNFVPLTLPMIQPAITNPSVMGDRLNPISISNREIGLFDGIPVWIKPWVPANMVMFYLKDTPNKVLELRTDPGTLGGGQFALNYADETYVLRAEWGGREFGVGVHERSAAAILDVAHSSFTAPTLTTY